MSPWRREAAAVTVAAVLGARWPGRDGTAARDGASEERRAPVEWI